MVLRVVLCSLSQHLMMVSSFKEMPPAIFELVVVLRQYVEERFPDSVHQALVSGLMTYRPFVVLF